MDNRSIFVIDGPLLRRLILINIMKMSHSQSTMTGQALSQEFNDTYWEPVGNLGVVMVIHLQVTFTVMLTSGYKQHMEMLPLLFISHPIRLPLPKPSRGLLQITLQRNPLRGNCCYALVPYEKINWTETQHRALNLMWCPGGVERGLLRALTQGNKVRPQGAGDLITTLRLIPLITNVSDLHKSQIKQTLIFKVCSLNHNIDLFCV